jgi:hypothetical protein
MGPAERGLQYFLSIFILTMKDLQRAETVLKNLASIFIKYLFWFYISFDVLIQSTGLTEEKHDACSPYGKASFAPFKNYVP